MNPLAAESAIESTGIPFHERTLRIVSVPEDYDDSKGGSRNSRSHAVNGSSADTPSSTAKETSFPVTTDDMINQRIPRVSSCLFVGGLSADTTDAELKEIFVPHHATDARIVRDKGTGESRRFGYVDFPTEEDATAVYAQADTLTLHGRKLRLDYASARSIAPTNAHASAEESFFNTKRKENSDGALSRPSFLSQNSSHAPTRCLFVGQLPFSVADEKELLSFFADQHAVSARIVMDKEKQTSKGFGYVTFESAENATQALEENKEKEFHGRILRLDYAEEKTLPHTNRREGNSRGRRFSTDTANNSHSHTNTRRPVDASVASFFGEEAAKNSVADNDDHHSGRRFSRNDRFSNRSNSRNSNSKFSKPSRFGNNSKDRFNRRNNSSNKFGSNRGKRFGRGRGGRGH